MHYHVSVLIFDQWIWQVKEKHCVNQKVALKSAIENSERKVMSGNILDSAH